MSWDDFSDYEYISVAELKQRALRKIKSLQESGEQVDPVDACGVEELDEPVCHLFNRPQNRSFRNPRADPMTRQVDGIEVPAVKSEIA